MVTRARIAAYKVYWKLGCFDSDILAAMDQVIVNGVHIISLSVGATGYAPSYYHDYIAIGAFGTVNIAPWIITVGASTIDREFLVDVVLGDGRVFNGVSLYSGDPLGDSG
uniref:Uncharacterized protein n=1 Tax=Nelumbo nucifera TaxID=4432 RepID=A0A822Z230_NELNU|nr:TPA_asm: hypothetical protein HUJ06_013169 [Nelumbo nucifera]